ncbi:hypothetical protein D3869_23055 (plasmid) [Azospirillum brasilense]|uniref:Uncharacterized protein n=1 Tax=Azospirillum brasilense TaxID=192 RepID=A0A4D8R896_AZOBR|nr:hypothetical protein D3869_23055 [Azospirillum brasilense]
MTFCPLPNPPPLTQGRGRPPLRRRHPLPRSGGGPGWGQYSAQPCSSWNRLPQPSTRRVSTPVMRSAFHTTVDTVS